MLLVCALILPSCSIIDYFKDEPAVTLKSETGGGISDVEIAQANYTGHKDAQIDSLQEKIVLLEGKVKTLESRMAGQKKIIYTIEYSDPAQLYKEARTLLLAKDLENASDLFATFAKKHPDHALADNAVYWVGECHYTSGHYQEAINVFKGLVKSYPKAEKVPDALLKTGYAYISLDDSNRASHYLKLVLKKHPFSPAAEKAQIKLNEFQ